MGGYAGYGKADPNERNVEAYETILSADLGGNDGPGWDWDHFNDNSDKVVDGSGTDPIAVLDGFTVTRVIGGDAGLYNSNGSPTVVNCTFSWNWASGDGGGISNWNSSAPRVTNCAFIQNVGEDHGGGVLNNPSCDSIIINCSFTGNSVGIWNGQGWSYSGNLIATNCTFTGNSWAGIINYASSFVVTNGILWDDKLVSEYPGFPYVRPTITYSDVKGGWKVLMALMALTSPQTPALWMQAAVTFACAQGHPVSMPGTMTPCHLESQRTSPMDPASSMTPALSIQATAHDPSWIWVRLSIDPHVVMKTIHTRQWISTTTVSLIS
jgi:hypothetical protein